MPQWIRVWFDGARFGRPGIARRKKEDVAKNLNQAEVLLPIGSSGVPGGWCCVVRRKLLFSNDLWRKAGHSVYRTQATEIKRFTMNLREQPPGTPEELSWIGPVA